MRGVGDYCHVIAATTTNTSQSHPAVNCTVITTGNWSLLIGRHKYLPEAVVDVVVRFQSSQLLAFLKCDFVDITLGRSPLLPLYSAHCRRVTRIIAFNCSPNQTHESSRNSVLSLRQSQPLTDWLVTNLNSNKSSIPFHLSWKKPLHR